MHEAVNNLENEVKEVEKLECQSGRLNKEVGSSFMLLLSHWFSGNMSIIGLKAEVEGYLRAIEVHSTTCFGRGKKSLGPRSYIYCLWKKLSLMIMDDRRQN
jgi:hypothetical protein